MSKINKDRFYRLLSKPTLKERLEDLKYAILFWKGRKMKYITTRNIEWGDIRYIFFPRKVDKYGYMSITFYKGSEFNKVLLPLVLAMDYEAKPWWCPRWFLRFLHVFGNDKSIVRVRNHRLSNLHRKLTRGIQFWDWKTKWSDYDLRISISGPEHLNDLASWIENGFYKKGYQNELIKQIKELDPNASTNYINTEYLEKQLKTLADEKETKQDKKD